MNIKPCWNDENRMHVYISANENESKKSVIARVRKREGLTKSNSYVIKMNPEYFRGFAGWNVTFGRIMRTKLPDSRKIVSFEGNPSTPI
jgi:hypothetical protein